MSTTTTPGPVPVVQPIRIEWAEGYALIEAEPLPDWRKDEQRQRRKALEIAKINGRRRPFKPEGPSTRYNDPAKPRRLDQVWGDLPFDKDDTEGLGQEIFPGWVITQTDGNYAVSELGTAADRQGKAPIFQTEIAWLGRLPPEAWRAYAPIRPMMNPRTKQVRWLIGPQGFAWHVRNWDGDEAKGEYRMIGPDAGVMSTDTLTEIILADGYLWPCRGLDYPKVGIVKHARGRQLPALVLEYGSLGVVRRIVIMSMEER